MPRAHLHKSKGRKGGGKAAWRKGKARKQKNKGPPTAKEKKAAAAKIQAEIRRKQAQVKEIERRRAEQKAEEKAAFLERQRRLSAPPARPKTSGAAREFMHTIEDNLEEAELRMEEIRQKFEQVDKNNRCASRFASPPAARSRRRATSGRATAQPRYALTRMHPRTASNTICKAEACHILETLGMVEGDVSFDEVSDR